MQYIAALVALSSQSPSADLAKYLDSFGQQRFRGMLYIEQTGKERFFHTVGYADPDSKVPLTRHTGICIGSIVKPMVRVALLKLEQQGKLSFSDPISKYFDGVPPDKAGITLQLLAEHKSGFRDTFGGDYQPIERDELMKRMLESKLVYKPGEKEQYSNSGFSMLSTVIEKVTGSPIEEVIKRTQFDPIGLKKTGYVLPKWKKQDLAVGYGPLGRRWGTPLDHFWYPDGPSWHLRGNGGMLSTVLELAKWSHAVNQGVLVTREQHKRLVPRLYDGDEPADRYSVSAGGNGIFTTLLLHNPKRKVTVVVASFDGRFDIESVSDEVLKRIKQIVAEPA